jgi:hypothetical protein
MVACECVLFIALLVAGVSVSVFAYPFERPSAYAAGLFAGCAFCAVKILLLDRTLTRAVDMGSHAKNYVSLHAAIRYIGTVVAFVPALAFPKIFGLFGVIAGILSMQLAAYLTHAVMRRLDRKANL